MSNHILVIPITLKNETADLIEIRSVGQFGIYFLSPINVYRYPDFNGLFDLQCAPKDSEGGNKILVSGSSHTNLEVIFRNKEAYSEQFQSEEHLVRFTLETIDGENISTGLYHFDKRLCQYGFECLIE